LVGVTEIDPTTRIERLLIPNSHKRLTMNRRSLVFGFLALSLAGRPNCADATIALPAFGLVKRLAPNAREIRLTRSVLNGMAGPLLLRPSGNALWIESVSWLDADGATQFQVVRRNVPKDMSVMLWVGSHPSRITVAVRCLPLAARATEVELRADRARAEIR
jgi:hypothetical protein